MSKTLSCPNCSAALDYQVIATLGPSSNNAALWQAMIEAGATAFRLNTSHLSLEELRHWLAQLRPFLASLDPPPPLVLDLQGSKWRLGEFAACTLTPGQSIALVYAASAGQSGVLPVPHLDFFRAASASSGEIVLNDARIRLLLESTDSTSMSAKVTQGGEISARKGITYTSSGYRQEALNDKDRTIFEQTRQLEFIRYAISYVKDAAEMTRYRAHFGRSTTLIAKLERQPAVGEAQQIAKSADELWLCRGDLGAELGLKAMAEVVHDFSDQVTKLSVPILMAGQVLEHMTEHPTPTRSEVAYLYDTLRHGYRGFVLSDEAAIGRYPIESCRVAAMFRLVV
jgi:pyruvate kinase